MVRTETKSGVSLNVSRVRHIEMRELWVQDRVAKGELKIVKVKGQDNVADGLTKHVDNQKMEQYMKTCGIVRRSGRHELSPELGGCTLCVFILCFVLPLGGQHLGDSRRL